MTGFYMKHRRGAAAKPKFIKGRCAAIVAIVWHYRFLNFSLRKSWIFTGFKILEKWFLFA